MLYRKISRLIEDHLRAQDPRILLVDGARQVGKTYIIRYVGKQLFEILSRSTWWRTRWANACLRRPAR